MGTQGESDGRLPRLNLGEELFHGSWLLSILAVVALPLVAGYGGACFIFGTKTVKPDVAPWATLIMVAILLIWLVLSHIVELILRRMFDVGNAIVREFVSTVVGVAILAACYRLVFTGFLPAFTAAALSSATMLACIPVVRYMGRRAPRSG